MAHVQRFDHIGITVADLESATAFFVGLGLEVEGTGSVEGEFVETVCGIPGAKCEIAMLRPPGEGSRLELSSFVTPEHVPGSPAPMANEIGIRNVSFEVGDLQVAVDAVAADGYGLIGGIGEYENSVRMAYVRGPEGIIVSLSSRSPEASRHSERQIAFQELARAPIAAANSANAASILTRSPVVTRSSVNPRICANTIVA